MPSFDLVSRVDLMELKNVVNHTLKQIAGRYDFKGAHVKVELHDDRVDLEAPDEYKIKAALDILRTNMAKRNIGMKVLEPGDIKPSGRNILKQTLTLRQGVDKEQGKIINKIIKNSTYKVTSAYLDEKIRVTGKKIDELQEVFSTLKNHNDVKVELQMENMKR